MNASSNAGQLDPEIPQCSAVPRKKNKGEVHKENDGKSTVRVVNVSVCPSLVSVRPCQLDRPLIRPTSIRVTTR